MVQDASFFEAGRALLGALVSPEMGIDSQGIKTPSAERIVEAGATVSMGATMATLLIKSSLTLVSEMFKPPPQQILSKARMELENRARGCFSPRTSNPSPWWGGRPTQGIACKPLRMFRIQSCQSLPIFSPRSWWPSWSPMTTPESTCSEPTLRP